MTPRHRAAVAVAVLGTATFAIAVALTHGVVTRWVDDCGSAAAAVLTAALCAHAAASARGHRRRFWALLTLAGVAWTGGEATWSWYELHDGSTPAASWADVLYLAALVPVAAALLMHPSLRGRKLGRTRSIVDGLVIVASMSFLAWVALFHRLSASHDVMSRNGLVAIAYPAGDVVVLVLVVLVVRGTTSVDRRALWWLLGGLTLMAGSDGVYSYLVQVQNYATGSVIDSGWIASYLAIGVAAVVSHAAVDPVRVVRTEHPTLTPAAVITPLLVLLAALSVLTIRLHLHGPLDGVSIALAFALVLLVLLRQTLLVVDVVADGDPAQSIAQRLTSGLGGAR